MERAGKSGRGWLLYLYPMQNKNVDVDSILAALEIGSLNDMQNQTLEAAASHDNLILLSATGSGKTLAYLLPVLNTLVKELRQTQALIVVPSRELALQIEQVFRSMRTGFKITCCYGGHKREIEENSLVEAPALIVGTPGRLADHIRRNNITTASIKTLVLDEFDKSLEMGFVEDISFIISALPSLKKRILTSATDAVDIPSFIGADDAFRLNFIVPGQQAENVLAVTCLTSPQPDKIETLFELLCSIGDRSSIIFCNHRESVERVSSQLSGKSILNVFYHGAMEQKEREVALAKFRNGTVNFLVTTDLAARGLDIPNIRYIIHYHLPATQDVFTHRNGRTARMDASGTVVLLLGPGEKLPGFIKEEVKEMKLHENAPLPEKPKWTTLFIGAGKKDKLNRSDIVGFLSHKAALKKEDIGLIDVKDFFAFAAIRKSKASHTLQMIKDQKIKNKKVKIDVAK